MEKLELALTRPPVQATRRDAVLPKIPGKAHAVVGMCRAGKTTFLWQLHADRLPEELIQVCADVTEPGVFEREFRALADAASLHPKARRRLLVATFDALPAQWPSSLVVEPAWHWLLEGPERAAGPSGESGGNG